MSQEPLPTQTQQGHNHFRCDILLVLGWRGLQPQATPFTVICWSLNWGSSSSRLLIAPLASIAAIRGQQICGPFLWLGLYSQKKLASSSSQLSFPSVLIGFRLVCSAASIQFSGLMAFSQPLLWGHLTLFLMLVSNLLSLPSGQGLPTSIASLSPS